VSNKVIYTPNVPTNCVPTLSHQLSQPLSQSQPGKWRGDGRDERSTHIV